MIKHCLSVIGQKIYGTQKVLLASDANQTICFKFDFEREWRKLAQKAAIFGRVNEEPIVIALEENIAIIPWEVLTKPEPFFLSVIAYDGAALLTTQKSLISVGDSFLPDEMKASNPSENIFSNMKNKIEAQLKAEYQAQLSRLEDELSSAKEELSKLTTKYNKSESALREMVTEVISLEKQITFYQSANAVLQKRAAQAQAWDDFWEDTIDLNGTFTDSSMVKRYGANLPHLNTVNAISASSLFGTDLRGNTIENVSLRCDKVTSLQRFASLNTSLKTAELINLSDALTNMNYAFYNCKSLESIMGDIDMSNVTVAYCVFDGCTRLRDVSFKEKSINLTISFSGSEDLSVESMISILNGLNPENGSGKTLKMSAFQKMSIRTSDFSYNDGTTTYYGDAAYYWAVIDKNWSFSGWVA